MTTTVQAVHKRPFVLDAGIGMVAGAVGTMALAVATRHASADLLQELKGAAAVGAFFGAMGGTAAHFMVAPDSNVQHRIFSTAVAGGTLPLLAGTYLTFCVGDRVGGIGAALIAAGTLPAAAAVAATE